MPTKDRSTSGSKRDQQLTAEPELGGTSRVAEYNEAKLSPGVRWPV
jgi:hypothetical protein